MLEGLPPEITALLQLFQKSGGASAQHRRRPPLLKERSAAATSDTLCFVSNRLGCPPQLHGPMLRQEPRWMNSAGKLTVSKLEPLFFCCIRLMDSTAARAIS